MSRILHLTFAVTAAAWFSGCALCCAPFDCDYPSVPGRWVRTNPSSGRVGSAFDEAGGPADVVTASAEEIPAPTPAATPQNVTPPSSPSDRLPMPTAPTPRSVLPRNLGETYLPRGQ